MSLFNKLWQRLAKNKYLYVFNHMLDADYRQALNDMKHTAAKSPSDIQREMSLVKDYWHIYPIQYVRYRLFEKHLDDASLLDYVPPYHFYHKYLPSLKAPVKREFDMLKVEFAREFEKRGVPAPQTLCVVHPSGFKTLMGESIDVSEILQSLSVGEHVFIKPNFGSGGYGIIRAEIVGEGRIKVNGKVVTLEQLPSMLDKKQCYVFQKELHQREDISQINPSCINTLRAITQTVDGEVKLKCVIMRLGRSGSFVDNSAQGGMSLAIDIDTGAFADAAITEHGNQKFESHPDSGFVFKGSGIAGWQQIKNGIIDIARKFPEFVLVGWDVAITDGGVSVLEANERFGISHVQCTLGGVRRVFDIYPD